MTTAPGPSGFRTGSWDLGLALGIWIVFMAVMALGALSVSGGGESQDPRILLGALPAQLLAVLFVPWVVRLRSQAWIEELGLYAPATKGFLRGLLDYLWVAPVWWLFLWCWMLILGMATDHEPEQEAMKLLIAVLTGPHALGIQLAVLFVTTLGAAASEELLFRGLLQGALRRYLGKQQGALILGAFFGLVHLQPNLLDSAFVVPPLAVLGYLLSLVRERRGGLWACILIHAANNGLGIFFALKPWS